MPGASPYLELEAEVSSLGEVTEFIRKGAREASLPVERVSELDLLIEEIFMNVCRHAYPDGIPGVVRITYSVSLAGELKVEVADQGIEFNPLEAGPANTTLDLEHRPIGGLGICLLKTLAPSLSYCREGGWNRLSFGISGDS